MYTYTTTSHILTSLVSEIWFIPSHSFSHSCSPALIIHAIDSLDHSSHLLMSSILSLTPYLIIPFSGGSRDGKGGSGG